MEYSFGTGVRMLMLQFSFSNIESVPMSIWDRKRESMQEALARKEKKAAPTPSLPLISEPYPEDVYLAGLPESLVKSNWTMIDAFYQPRHDKSNPDQFYHTVRFSYVHSSDLNNSDQEQVKFQKYFMPLAHVELVGMVRLALWRVRAFKNPFFENHQLVPGKYAVSMNFEARKPLFLADGSQVVQDNHIVTPRHHMFIRGDSIIQSTVSARPVVCRTKSKAVTTSASTAQPPAKTQKVYL